MRKLGLVPVLSLLFAAVLPAAENPWTVTASVLTILEDNGNYGDPAPVLPVPGVSYTMPLKPGLSFEPSVDLYSTYYLYSSDLDRAVPAAIENRSSRVIGLLCTAPVSWQFPVLKGFDFRVYGGLALDFRLALTAGGLEGSDAEDATDQTWKNLGYFWGGGRWLLPMAGCSLDRDISDRFILGGSFRIWVPAYHLWTGEDLGFVEDWKIALGLRLRLKPKAAVPDQSPDGQSPQ